MLWVTESKLFQEFTIGIHPQTTVFSLHIISTSHLQQCFQLPAKCSIPTSFRLCYSVSIMGNCQRYLFEGGCLRVHIQCPCKSRNSIKKSKIKTTKSRQKKHKIPPQMPKGQYCGYSTLLLENRSGNCLSCSQSREKDKQENQPLQCSIQRPRWVRSWNLGQNWALGRHQGGAPDPSLKSQGRFLSGADPDVPLKEQAEVSQKQKGEEAASQGEERLSHERTQRIQQQVGSRVYGGAVEYEAS